MNLRQTFLKCTFALLVGTLLIGCSGSDNENDDTTQLKLMGLWVAEQLNGEPLPTNDYLVYDIKTLSHIYESFCIPSGNGNTEWMSVEARYTLSGNDLSVYVTAHNNTIDIKLKELTDKSMTWNVWRVDYNGDVTDVNQTYGLRRLTDDYSKTILGMWEGRCITSGQPNDLHRWLYFADGTYAYYSKDTAGEWQEKQDNEGTYLLYGDLLVTSWQNNHLTGTEGSSCEVWQMTATDKAMTWKATRGDNLLIEYAMTRVDCDCR